MIDYRDAKFVWPGLYKAVHEILGDAHVILPFGDELVAGRVNGSTFEAKQMGATGPSDLTWTPSEAMSAFSTALDVTDPANWKGVIPLLTLNGTDEEADTPDDAFYSTVGAFSVGAWIYLNTAESNVILAKWDETTGAQLREWIFELDSNGDIGFRIYDESENAEVGRKQEAALSTGSWYFVVGTFSGGTDAANVSIAVNGVLTDDADLVDDAGFANAEDLATVVSLGYLEGTGGAKENFLDGKMAGGPLGPFFAQKELSATEHLDLYHIGAHALGLA